MEKIRKLLIIILYSIAVLVVVSSILSVFRNTESRYLKMLDFPRIQFFLVTLVCLIIVFFVFKFRYWYNYLIIFALLLGLVINGRYLINYTPFVATTVPSQNFLNPNDELISILIVNVKMSNRNMQPLLEQIDIKKPDLLLAMEIDTWLDRQLHSIEMLYPYSKEIINEVAYGMVLYSKFPLDKLKVDYVNNKNVPLIESMLTLLNGKKVDLYCVHPVPPAHFKNLPDNEGQHEIAMKKLGKQIESKNSPTIVMGDLNDVVWSNVDELTNTKNLLFDIRTGRGFYNSYNAENFLMRWPLDHVYVTKEFRLKKIERLDYIGSDHFPIYVELVL
ncbi:endonuclease/exonuclease/phosphatase (EEP) superfamily protein YafD [Mariniflexile fucanivorans]|uniref:Endonuclease/exonuclease/phosphatase (EEP) superfamily protein YafD n=1 Tax=Mariniflexile fucanivorans TaxID=264023 RepID=A0A4R1RMH3_9FLAO|nr:endonuclease/exonuclease/phosphatase family protein [Mariniflexile fucanivorans]TCL67481.1 endonuclease/exonuclease/phosphatase (EEP) superfamily protein YafD [Mariniflexile fucanivorans]